MLKDKPTILHLKGDIVIDNTKSDPRLEELKRRIFELAKQQPHWGEERPARWLPLEQAFMTLKASGAKVVPLSLVEEINRSGSVRIEDKDELELFLRFQHEMGTILFFSVEGLREKIVLDPQWLIDALKSLITAEIFISINPAITRKWFEFKEDGKLTQELIDAIWTKKENPDFHDNKEHILVLMEKLNIIARPRSYGEDGKIKEENYYLAPCMLRQATPKEIITPESNPQVETTAVICFMSTEKFLPPPVFHRLIGACLTHWPIAQQESENLIYCGCCAFDLDLHHRLTVHLRDYVIFARVRRIGVTDMSQSSELCSEARNFISENLSKIIGNVGKSLEFELHIQCPNSDANSLDGLIAVSVLQKNEIVPCHSHKTSHPLESKELLKFWYKKQVNIGGKAIQKQSPILQAKDVPSTTKSKPLPSTKQPRTKQINPKTKVQATSPADKKGIYDSVLRKLSEDLISHNWKFFFRELSVADNELDLVEIDYRHSVQEQIYQLLRRLNQRGSLKKTNIIQALKSIGRKDLVNKYSRKDFSAC